MGQLKRVYRLIEYFEMMGYNVELMEELAAIEVGLRTNKGYVVSRVVNFRELELDFIIEHVVRELNELIIKEL